MAKQIKENTSKEEKIVDNVNNSEDTNINLEKQLLEEKQRNNDLENKLNALMSMVENLTKNQNTINTQNINNESQKARKSALQSYKKIDPNERILLINMSDAAGTYITHNGKPIRFEYTGHIHPVKFEDVESLRTKYRNSFENLEIRIIDNEDAIDALYLRNYYDKYGNITFEELEDIILFDAQSMIKKIKSLSKPLQESAISLIISGVARKEQKYLDKNKWDVIKSEYKVDIDELSKNYII